jgi:hypothetical protein
MTRANVRVRGGPCTEVTITDVILQKNMQTNLGAQNASHNRIIISNLLNYIYFATYIFYK